MAKSNHTFSRISSGNASRDILGRALGVSLIAASMGACSSNGVSTGPESSDVGGGASQSTGGAPGESGGTSPGAVGGAPGTGGAATNMSTGGTSAVTVATGGASATGGVAATGGSSSLPLSTGGRTAAAGGRTSTGGTATAGGKTSTGGSAATGGKTSTGGTAATGGKTSTGGSPATGTGGSSSTCTPSSTKFSFFVTSQARLFALAQAFNGSTKGFGGDLRYGQTTGLAGADKICTVIAEASMPGNCKTWRAFLSVADNGSGAQVNAISRIGTGPWYDRVGRLFGNSPTTIVTTRPDGASTIINDLPNEDGILNHDALQSGNTTNQDNHDIMTGSSTTGTLYNASGHCINWTSSAADTSKKPRVGHSWPRSGSGQSWISCLDESGCAPGANLVDTGGPGNDGTVGSGGGYGAFYCFALSP